MNRLILTLIAAVAMLTNPTLVAAADGSTAGVDLRVLIDVSGSMKKNDPGNLRRSALRLLVGVLPEDASAGVWTFGHYVNMQIPLGVVDGAWKEQARIKAGEIHSRGLFTNIEEALKASTRDWTQPAEGAARHLLLLTDGMVDISKDAAENNASRQRVLADVLPVLKARGAKVHTVALSDRADRDLMQGLSEATGGWFEQADTSEQLQRVFLKMFEQVSKPDSLPLSDNRFTVDDSVRELTLVVFTTNDGEPTRIRPPNGETFDANAAPDGVKWHGDIGYDLITIEQPAAGEWEILAAVDPDNRAMVVTDLKMVTPELPARVVQGQDIALFASFTEGGEPIVRADFLQLISVQAEGSPEGADASQATILDMSRAADASKGFALDWTAELPAGRAELVTRAIGATFSRESRQMFEMVPPVTLALGDATAGGVVPVTVQPTEGVLDAVSVKIEAKVVDANSASTEVAFVAMPEGGWQSTFDPSTLAGEARLQVSVSGQTMQGASFTYLLPSEAVLGQLAIVPAEPAPVVAEEAEQVSEATAVAEAEAEPEAATVNWTQTLSIFGAANLLILVIGGWTFWFLRRRNKGDKELQLVEEKVEAAAA